MRLRNLLSLGLVLGPVAFGACQPGPFDDLAKKAPVQAIDAPGTTLLALRQGQAGSRGTLLAATPGSAFVVDLISFDASGKASKSRYPEGALLDNTTYSPVVMAEVPSHEPEAWVVAGTPLVAQPNTSGEALLLKKVADGATSTEAIPVDGADSHFGRGVLISPSTGDIFVSSELLGPTVFVAGDRTPSKKIVYAKETGDTCAGAFDALFASTSGNGASSQVRAMVELQPRTATTPALIAAGDPLTAGAGGVSFFTLSSSTDTTPAAVHCFGRLSSTEPRFGQTLATGDFNGDGTLDLAVGAPPKAVYVFFGPLSAAVGVVSGQGKATLTSANSTAFGSSLVALTPAGASQAQLAVGDYGATVEGVANAGSVGIYAFATGLPDSGTLSATLSDPSPEGGGAFGQALTLLPFCRSPNESLPRGCEPAGLANLLTVGATNELFVFFNHGEQLGSTGDARDPR